DKPSGPGGTAGGAAGGTSAGTAGGTAAGAAGGTSAGTVGGTAGGTAGGAAAGSKGAPAAGPGATTPSAAVTARARLLRRANPVRVVRRAGRSTSAWAKRPSGRLILPAIIAVVLLGVAGTAGAYLVPQALKSAPSPSASPGFPL